jgi:glycosyltransferase involved in cell wall biosynthesis
MASIFCHYPDKGESGTALYRAILPCRMCAPELLPEGIALIGSPILDQSGKHDCYIFSRPIDQSFLPYLRELKKAGRIIVWSMDDDELAVPYWNPVQRTPLQIQVWQECLRLADVIWTSTEVLQKKYGGEVLPNLIAPQLWPSITPETKSPVRIVWAGSPSHEVDLNNIVPAITRIISHYQDKVLFLFFGYLPTALAKFSRIAGTEFAKLVPMSRHVGYASPIHIAEYPAALCDLRPDIGLCPLADHRFNEAKSPIKWMEYVMAGAAVIASGGEPYERVIDGTGLIANDWFKCMSRLIEDAPLRHGLWTKARGAVLQNHSWEASAQKQKWLDAFRCLAQRIPSKN